MIEPDAQEISLPDVLLPLLVVKLVDETVAVLRPLKLQKNSWNKYASNIFQKSLKTANQKPPFMWLKIAAENGG